MRACCSFQQSKNGLISKKIVLTANEPTAAYNRLMVLGVGAKNCMGAWGLGKVIVVLLAAMVVGWLKEEERSTSLV